MTATSRSILNATLTDAATYTSGALAVGDLFELAIDCTVTAEAYSGGDLRIDISRIGADGNLYVIDTIDCSGLEDQTPFVHSTDAGAGTFTPSGTPAHTFGDHMQLDLVASSGNTLTATLSIIGKG